MVLVPLKQAITNNGWKPPRLIATDMDGTLTQQGKFTASLLQSLEDLSVANIPVLIVTGRSAGWVTGLASYRKGNRQKAEGRPEFIRGQKDYY